MSSHAPKKEYRMRRLAIAAAGAAVLSLTACSHSGPEADSGRGATGAAGGDRSTAPVSCQQQYRAWRTGQGKGVMDALEGVSSAAAAGRGQSLIAALDHAKPAVAKATQHPIPACADPRGYWSVLLMHVHAAASSTGSAAGARAAVQDVPKLMDSLVADVDQAAR
jgi:hypothetical protein